MGFAMQFALTAIKEIKRTFKEPKRNIDSLDKRTVYVTAISDSSD